jgi:hypothetical protein
MSMMQDCLIRISQAAKIAKVTPLQDIWQTSTQRDADNVTSTFGENITEQVTVGTQEVLNVTLAKISENVPTT